MSIAYSERAFVDSIMQHAKLKRRIILSSVACPAVPFCLPYYLIKDTIFEKRVIEHERLVSIFSKILSEEFLILIN